MSVITPFWDAEAVYASRVKGWLEELQCSASGSDRERIAHCLQRLAEVIGDRDKAKSEACLMVANLLERWSFDPPGTTFNPPAVR